jgi:hypothetical protein
VVVEAVFITQSPPAHRVVVEVVVKVDSVLQTLQMGQPIRVVVVVVEVGELQVRAVRVL